MPCLSSERQTIIILREGWDFIQREEIVITYPKKRASLMAQMVMQGLPVIQEIQIQSLGQEDPLEKGMATHPSILAWRIPWAEEPGRLQFIGSQRTGLN